MKPRILIRVTDRYHIGYQLEVMIGYVNRHPKWPDEEWHGPIATSPIVKYHDDVTVETENTMYIICD